jgi:DNA-binding NtrC family response regulator
MQTASRGTILAVSADPATRGYLRRVLTSWGFDVLEAATSSLAAEAARRRPVELVFLDLSLPEAETDRLVDRLLSARATLQLALISTAPEAGYSLADEGQGRVLACLSKPLLVERIDRIVTRVFGEL